jgi:uncharacterized protein (TIGR03545 family)
MSRSPRWQTWTIRLLVAGIVALAAQLGLDIAVRSLAVRSGKTVFGTGVEVRHSHLSLLNRQVILDGLQVAAPGDLSSHALEADHCELELATRPLLYKQVVVNRGRVSGIRFTAFGDSASDGSSSQSVATNPAAGWFGNDADAVANAWFTHLGEHLNHDVSSQFESVQKTEAFCASWTEQSAALEARGADLTREAASLKQGCVSAQANPLRGGTFLSDLPQKLATLQKRFSDFNSELDKLPDQLETERRAIVAARRHDEQLAAQPLAIESAEASALSTYLLRDAAAKPIGDFVALLKWLQAAVPADSSQERSRSRGEDILFAGCQDRSNIMIRTLELDGTARIANRAIEMRGAVSNFTTAPALLNEPMRLRLQSVGPMPVELRAAMDRSHGAVHDNIVIDCQGLLLPPVELGRADGVALSLGPSTASLSVSISVNGDQLNGEIQMVQQNVHIAPAAADGFGEPAINATVAESLGHIESFATRVTLGGTLAEPKCTLWSNLGSAAAESMERAVQRAGSQHARSMMVTAGKRGDEQLTVVERQMTEQQTKWKTVFAATSADLQSAIADDKPADRLTTERLGRRLPNNSLFR